MKGNITSDIENFSDYTLIVFLKCTNGINKLKNLQFGQLGKTKTLLILHYIHTKLLIISHIQMHFSL